jgi:two-component sensor histidine kinase
MSGPEMTLPARTGLALGMALHELVTNAAKYGALSAEEGAVRLRWTISDDDHGRRLRLRWVETGGPLVEQPRRRGFGRRLIERTIQKDLGGELTLEFESSGLQASMSIPIS